MIVSYLITIPEPLILPPAAYLRIEIRDTSLADAPAITLAAVELHGDQIAKKKVITGDIELPGNITPKPTVTLWAHLSPSGDKRINKEDFITTRSFPVTKIDEHGQVVVEMQPVSR
jgi:putative lipoprotein